MKTWMKVLLALIVIGIVAGVLGYYFIYNKPHPKYETLSPEYTLEARELFDEFVANEQQAQQQYNGKMVQVQGMLDGIERVNDLVILTFDFEEGFFGMAGLRATMLESNQQQALELVTGAPITIKGYCAGFDESVILEHATIVDTQ